MPLQVKTSTLLLATLAVLALSACVTINVYFPEAKVQELSERIEEAVEREAQEQADSASSDSAAAQDSSSDDTSSEGTGAEGDTASGGAGLGSSTGISPPGTGLLPRLVGGLLDTLARASAPRAAYAQGSPDTVPAPEITNPAIRRIIESRAQRVSELNQLKAAGVLGENNRALVEVRNLDSLELKDRAKVQRLVKAENEDRQTMFREIAAATDVDLSQLEQIQSTYADTLRRKAKAGTWIQLADGSWQQKES
ncbi:MAG: DUF1318 domain-containing protein [Acidobacteriota bacterium]